MSTEEVLRALWYADQYVCKQIYYFHNDAAVEEFGQDRLDPLVQETPYFREQVQERAESGGAYNKSLKQIGKSTIYLRGLFTAAKAKTVDADRETFDEVDEINPEHMEFAEDRVLHSSMQHKCWLSQPSLPDYGIDLAFQDTDQRHYLLKCPACGEYNCLENDFPQNYRDPSPHFFRLTDRQAALQGRQWYRGCRKCTAELDMAAGEWVPQYPDRRRRGYWISGLYTQIRSEAYPEPADRIMDQFGKARTVKQKKRLVISVIGDAYGGDNKPITDEVLRACEGMYVMGPDAGFATGIGIDVGDIKHVVVRGQTPMGRKRILWVESTESWERIAEIIKFYRPPVFVCDAMPYKDNAKTLAKAFPGRGFIQYFQELKQEAVKSDDREKRRDEDGVPVVVVDRTETLDQTCDEFKNQEIEIPALKIHSGKDLIALEELHRQLKYLMVDVIEDSKGGKKRIYKGNVDNHYGMAANSARIAEGMAPYNVSSGVLPIWGEIH